MNRLNVKLPVFSHWGINGGGFFEKVGFKNLNLQSWLFIQTSFSFLQKDLTPFQTNVLNKAIQLFPDKIL